MADDLIIKFFQEDLTEAEDQRLREILSSSPEEAYRFFLHAEAAYRSYGLPEPRRPKGDPPSFWTHLSLWVWPVLLAAVMGSLGWAFFHVMQTPATQALVPVPKEERRDQLPSAKGIMEEKKLPDVPREEGTTLDGTAPAETNGSTPASVTQPDPPYQGVALSRTPMIPLPRNRSTHSNLEVVVHRSHPTPLAVEVLGPNGDPVVLLYQGMVQAGTWAFDWNGKLADGQKPPPGTYRIAVESGAVTQVKKVVIH